jgi:RHH-type proline utilization regulon transcriptional repressor/proline dehydrogenase/delta 1-pyrroline-5-carboxylate dehydrogenase
MSFTREVQMTPTTKPALTLRDLIRARHRCDEITALSSLLPLATLPPDASSRASAYATMLMTHIRATHAKPRISGGLDAFLREYDLSSHEGIALMCLAEALLRIPDATTVDRLIQDKIGSTDWNRHIPHSDSLFVHASTWALMLTGKLTQPDPAAASLSGTLKTLLTHTSEPLIRQALRAAMRLLGEQFVMGRDIHEALRHAAPAEAQGYRHSYDMLGEAALCTEDARRYLAAYHAALAAIAAVRKPGQTVLDAPTLSVKLSALHPRYEAAQHARVMAELLPVLCTLAQTAKSHDIAITIDAEESDRLALSLDVFAALAAAPSLQNWQGLGLAVQAYQKRAPAVIDWLAELARRTRRRLNVRLVKGAYWDSEIKLAQERGLDDYPVYTHKIATDIAYLACAAKLLDDPQAFYPQFATHNAHTVASLLEMAQLRLTRDFEFQRLDGMGRALYDTIIVQTETDPKFKHRPLVCRVYAPVGSHEDLLAYLVRRLLENGANSSFVHRLEDGQTTLDALAADPVALWHSARPPQGLPLPHQLYATARNNSRGLDMADQLTLQQLEAAWLTSQQIAFHAAPGISAHTECSVPRQEIRSPANHHDRVGDVRPATQGDVIHAITRAQSAQTGWDQVAVHERAACLERAADLLQERHSALIALISREGGRTLPDAMNEVREAIDFCRYYAAQARMTFSAPLELSGPTGERNLLSLHGRGVFACISPWNFPLAIFMGQVCAALVAGNAVIAKPAEQTPLTAAAAVDLLYQAGIPRDILQLLPGDATIGAAIVADHRIDGVAFTGSTETARRIALSLAQRGNAAHPVPLATLIAETGGINVMIADSSTLPEQLVRDVMASAFNSAGQRCSALRVLFVQSDIADKVLSLLAGAMQTLQIGNPGLATTDIGPLIDAAAHAALTQHVTQLESHARLIHQCTLPTDPASICARGYFFAPQAWEIERLAQLENEVFGPVLHVIRWQTDELDACLDDINASQYGLTLGIHSRIDTTVDHICHKVRIGNLYVNRNMIGAVVGVQPFGGEQLSGTGPKAGGPHYLLRFASECCLTINTAAAGGNTHLLTANGAP